MVLSPVEFVVDEDDALRGEEHAGTQTDRGGAKTGQVSARFLRHRKVVAENKRRALREFGFPDVSPLLAEIEKLIGGAILHQVFECSLGDGCF